MKSILLFCLLLTSNAVSALTLETFEKRPKLVVVLVIDQLRSDYLTRFGSRFLPAGGFEKPGGFRFLMKEGAYFPFAEFDILQSMTCPGHAMILTGTRPARLGFATNEWFDPKTKKRVTCTQDEKHGASPRRLATTTVGDEIKNVHAGSRVVTLASKTRSAVMLGGHRADHALWIDEKTGLWATSSYYGDPPVWMQKLNETAAKDKTRPPGKETTVAAASYYTKEVLGAAISAVRELKLGRGKGPDLLGVSLSDHDILGHMEGPNSPAMEEFTLIEDKLLSGFFNDLRRELGSLRDVTIVLTGDHGIPPTPDVATSFKLDSGKFEFLPVFRKINARLDEKFGSAGKKEWILGARLFHFFLNQELLGEKKLSPAVVENEVRRVLLDEPGVSDVFTRGDFDRGVFPPGPLGDQIRNSYIPGMSGDLVLIPKPFFMETRKSTTHVTGYSYDRQVPLLIVGRMFKPGVYAGGLIVDIAPTLTFNLGVIAPAKSEGRVLREALRD